MPKIPLKETPGSAEEKPKKPQDTGYEPVYQDSYTGGYNPKDGEEDDDWPPDLFEGAQRLPKQ